MGGRAGGARSLWTVGYNAWPAPVRAERLVGALVARVAGFGPLHHVATQADTTRNNLEQAQFDIRASGERTIEVGATRARLRTTGVTAGLRWTVDKKDAVPLANGVERLPTELHMFHASPLVMRAAHWHAQVEVNYIVRGWAHYRMSGHEVHFRAGYVPPDQSVRNWQYSVQFSSSR